MSAKFSFKDRNVLITGGADGIGLEIAKKFIESEANVFILDQDENKLSQVKASYPNVITIIADLTGWESTQKKIQELGLIHHLVNNAGLAAPFEYLLDIKPESVDKIFNVNIKGTLAVTQAVAKRMIEGKLQNATIVNIGSISDKVAVHGMATYSSSKAGVKILTKCMALELAEYGIRVNCVRPAQVKTDQVGKQAGPELTKFLESLKEVNGRKLVDRLVEKSEVADAVLFLSSSASSMVNGSDILLDGGLFTH